MLLFQEGIIILIFSSINLTYPHSRYKADINIIDYEGLTLHEPEIVNDLPAGGRRLVQKASGYEYTIVSGAIAFIKGEATGELNGKLIRSTH